MSFHSNRETVHIALDQPSLSTKDESLRERMKLLHFIIHERDHDWPFVHQYSVVPWDKEGTCAECGGRKYKNPLITPQEIKALARQLKLPIKIKRFAREARCYRERVAPVFQRVVS